LTVFELFHYSVRKKFNGSPLLTVSVEGRELTNFLWLQRDENRAE